MNVCPWHRETEIQRPSKEAIKPDLSDKVLFIERSMFIVAVRKPQRKKIEQMRGRQAKTSFLLLKADLFFGPKVFTCFSPFKLQGILSSSCALPSSATPPMR